ncbi:hypothetical protein [Phyllobacterium sophorae]|uniref:hypothetical protein n=1 Tax=Phyllobacterium sophorae TaxID=1520277 RepID=UPI0011B1C9A1|nr:hypothetical protein [Phyllobacterium sophorae]
MSAWQNLSADNSEYLYIPYIPNKQEWSWSCTLQLDRVNDNAKSPIDRHCLIVSAEQCGEQIAVNRHFESRANCDNIVVEHFAADQQAAIFSLFIRCWIEVDVGHCP